VFNQADVSCKIAFFTQGKIFSTELGDIVISASELLNEFENNKTCTYLSFAL